MAYYQAHLLLLAGYSQFFVSGLVLPQPPFESDEEDDMFLEDEEMDMLMQEEEEEDESPEAEPIVVDEFCPKFATTEEDEHEDEQEEPLSAHVTCASAAPEQKRRKRLSAVSESHVRTMSRWLRDSAISLGDRQRQISDPDSPGQRETRETKRLCTSANRKPRLPALQTSFSFLPPRLSVA